MASSDKQAEQAEQTKQDVYWMRRAIELAQIGQANGEVPVGAVLVRDQKMLAEGFNQPIQQNDPTLHAEIQVIRQAAKALNNYRILDSTLYVTLEPCCMCAGAIIQARISRVVFGAFDPKAGACGSVMNLLDHKQTNYKKLNHTPVVQGGVLEQPCAVVLKEFFKLKRSSRGLISCNHSSV
tara:strand:- start:124472 stop:125014 length:543 start_codon:yes stop_codon:yes gene_type:complete